MRRRLLGLCLGVGAALVMLTASPASAGASERASCVGIVTSWEATQLPPGSVGHEVSELAGPGFGTGFVAPLARHRQGSLEGCAEVVG